MIVIKPLSHKSSCLMISLAHTEDAATPPSRFHCNALYMNNAITTGSMSIHNVGFWSPLADTFARVLYAYKCPVIPKTHIINW